MHMHVRMHTVNQHVRVPGWMDGWMDAWMGAGLAGWLAGWMDGWMDRGMSNSIRFYLLLLVYVSMP